MGHEAFDEVVEDTAKPLAVASAKEFQVDVTIIVHVMSGHQHLDNFARLDVAVEAVVFVGDHLRSPRFDTQHIVGAYAGVNS
jgi:hypothetical protein